MNEPKDILTEFEENEERWGWHNELTFTALLVIAMPLLVIEFIIELFKRKKP